MNIENMEEWHKETREIANGRAEDIKKEFLKEVDHLIRSGASGNQIRGLLFGVALENIADRYIRKRDKDYKNLKCF